MGSSLSLRMRKSARISRRSIRGVVQRYSASKTTERGVDLMTMLTVLLYGFYLVVFSIFVALSILIVGISINEVKKRKE
jgi:hypothetical protein